MKILNIAVLFVVLSIAASSTVPDMNWWKSEVFYQVYPRSFKDSNNDGTGDLQGIIQKLSYFNHTRIKAIWLSPIFESPGVDQGYDISNYTKVDPLFGTNDDLKLLIEAAHELGIKVILDFVPNHTSDQHQWFIDSENRVDGYEDFYIWLDGKTDENGERIPPNNWISLFKNSSWTWSDKRQQYYLHEFAIAQPDLNYRNPKVVQTMKETLKFWLDFGVDGFRVDAVPYLFEDASFADEPLSGIPGYNNTDYEYLDHILTYNLQETFDLIYDWRDFLDQYTEEHGGDQRIMMTEAYAKNKTMLYYGTPDGSRLGAHFSFNFDLISNININSSAQDIVDQLLPWITDLPSIYTPNWVVGNHDNHRVATRYGPKNVDGYNMLILLLPGIGVTYNGEEIGMEDGEVSYEEGQDPSARDPAIFEKLSRDFERTPFHWDTTVNAGFNEGAKPWLPVSEKYLETNVADEQEQEAKSHYGVYTFLLLLRQVLEDEPQPELHALADQVLFLKRQTIGSFDLLMLFNKGENEETVDVTKYISQENGILILSDINSNRPLGPINVADLTLQPHESLCILI